MPDPRILTFPILATTGTTAFQIAYSGDQVAWTTLRVAGAEDIPVASLTGRQYVLDGVNTEDDADNNGAAASTPPNWYRTRLKAGGLYGQWSDARVFPSLEDFIAGMKLQLKDPAAMGGAPLLLDSDYRLKVANAVSAFESRHPRLASQVFDLTSGVYEYDQPDDWTPAYSFFVQAEYPADRQPRSFIPVDYVAADEATLTWAFRRVNPGPGEQCRVYFATRHARDGRTIPVSFYESVLMWATGDAAQQIRAKSNQFGDLFTGADYVSIDPRIREWAKIADSWKKQAEAVWGPGSTGVRAHIASYEDHGRVPPQVWGY